VNLRGVSRIPHLKSKVLAIESDKEMVEDVTAEEDIVARGSDNLLKGTGDCYGFASSNYGVFDYEFKVVHS
jgi:hypothetical protein